MTTYELRPDGMLREVADPPTRADLVQVVRCRNCKHYTEDDMEYYHYCGNWCEQVEPDGFCAWGKRRESE